MTLNSFSNGITLLQIMGVVMTTLHFLLMLCKKIFNSVIFVREMIREIEETHRLNDVNEFRNTILNEDQ